ncbi:monovalent cation/H+ antiporter subunit A [Lujinxingia litoralis]|uniref:Monovalent cation/H+ antiporter subunit A n=1 Tax=Lujinxingia litoralis TaxID=2211119 RepID=A0A328C3F2_9DELT|nr:monovalent cation/H+ antiporter subunit A [Lujinxingia litoralis]RAL20783.1 monovalent cation/H+ antiporter subunit A [Lujinxingia litoralis]
MTPLLIVLLPFVGLLLPILLARQSHTAATVGALLPTTLSLGLLLSMAGDVFAGETFVAFWPWIETLGLNLSFRVDGLGMLFAILILGIGTLVVLYAHYYLSDDDPRGRFFGALLAFMGAMLGVVLSENVLLLAFFWEITSLSSFLLIAYWTHVPLARQGARMALAITGMGGLLLFAGMLLIGHIVGSYELSAILASASRIQSHALYLPALLLVLMGAFTKSAQFPFHFWLPNAMTAPTPVSAYLHSATMVKAGVFLLARMHPALSGTPEWFFLVTGAGLVTLTFAAYVALFKHDLKGLLAYSTISHLGLITTLFGFGTPMAALVGVFHIMNHAAFKASLFMSVGIVDHEAGTRDMRILGGLRHAMPITMTLATLGAAAMAGIPGFNGFLSKEMFFYESWKLPFLEQDWIVPVIVTVAGLLSMAYSVRLVIDTFFGEVGQTPAKPHDPPFGMWMPVAVLVTICVVIGVYPAAGEPLLNAAAMATIGGALPQGYDHIALWHGFNAAVVMSLIAIFGGAAFFTLRFKLFALAERYWPDLYGKRVFEGLVNRVVDATRATTVALDNGSLQRYIMLLIAVTVVAGAIPFFLFDFAPGNLPRTALEPVTLVIFGIFAAACIGVVVYHKQRLVALSILSVVGLSVSLFFVKFSAPDLALTQLSVEVVTIMLLLLALYVLPKETPSEGGFSLRKVRDGVLSTIAGLGTGWMSYMVMTRPQDSISMTHLEKAYYPVGGGKNVVNVTLVDIRGFDTMGEVSVLAMAGLGIYALLANVNPAFIEGVKSKVQDRFPVMLTSATRPLMSMILIVAVYIFFRGHYLPGGGFIAGLVATVALIIQYMASGQDWSNERMPINFRTMAVIGVLIAVASGASGLLVGKPFMTMLVPLFGEPGIGMAVFFDLGVFLGVVGGMMVILSNLGALNRSDTTYDSDAYRKETNPWKP